MDWSVLNPSIVIHFKWPMDDLCFDTPPKARLQALDTREMAKGTGFKPLVSVVNYNIASSYDPLSEIESPTGQAFVYTSCYLPAPEFLGQSLENDSAIESKAE